MNAQLLESVCLHDSSMPEDTDYVLVDADMENEGQGKVELDGNSKMTVEQAVCLDEDAYDHCEDTDIFLSSKWKVSSIEEGFSVLADVCEDKEQFDLTQTSHFDGTLTFVSDDEDEEFTIASTSQLKDDDESVASVVTTASQTGKRSSSTSCGIGSAPTSGGSRLCNKKRRRKMKKLKKEAAAAAAAERLLQQNSKLEGNKNDSNEQQRKSAQLAVACATKTLAAYKEEQAKRDLAKSSNQ